jgi:hypothetical protein
LILDIAVAGACPRQGEEQAIQRDFVRGKAFFFGRTVIGERLAFARPEMD